MTYPALILHCKALKLPELTAEYKFHPTRKWRFDYCMESEMIGIEINGGIFIQGRHTRGAGQQKDMEKLNEAQRLGYRVFQFTPKEANSGVAANYLFKVIYE